MKHWFHTFFFISLSIFVSFIYSWQALFFLPLNLSSFNKSPRSNPYQLWNYENSQTKRFFKFSFQILHLYLKLLIKWQFLIQIQRVYKCIVYLIIYRFLRLGIQISREIVLFSQTNKCINTQFKLETTRYNEIQRVYKCINTQLKLETGSLGH